MGNSPLYLQIFSMIGPLVLVGAMALTAGLIVALKPVLIRYALARPNARSSHREPTPQGGGLAVTAAVIIMALVILLWRVDFGPAALSQVTPVLAATTLLAICGVVDDIRTLGIIPRLVLHAIAVATVITTLPPDLRIIDWIPWWAERALLVLAGIWFINLVNFMDGLDWITVAEVVPVSIGLILVGSLGALPPAGILVALALLGAILGFAPFNRPVARLFLGDVGSLPIGLLIGWLLVLVAGAGHLAAAVLLPLYYLADATVTLLRRIGNGEKVWQAHRTHFYQRATSNGFTVIQVVGHIFVVNMCLMALAVATVFIPSALFDVGAVSAGLVLVTALLVKFVRRETP